MKIVTENYTLHYTRRSKGQPRGTIRQFSTPFTAMEYTLAVQKKVFRAFPEWNYRLDRADAPEEWEICTPDPVSDAERAKMTARLERLSANARRELGIFQTETQP